MNIDKFKATVNDIGLMEGNRYKIYISSPSQPLSPDYASYASKVTLPGQGFSTIERFDHGPERNVPYLELYSPINITFICDREMKIYKFFERWQSLIGGNEGYYISFYDDIVGSCTIHVLDRQGNITSAMELIECWPSKITDIELSYDSTDIKTFDVELTYHHHEILEIS